MDFKTLTLSFAFILNVACFADTFRHNSKGIVYTGYAKQTLNKAFHTVVTKEKGILELNLSEYTVEPNSKGRNKHIALIKIEQAIEYELQAAAFE